MDIWMIWVRASASDPARYWLEDAWDDDSVSEDRQSWSETVDKAYETYGGANVRVSKTTVDFDKVTAAFDPAEV